MKNLDKHTIVIPTYNRADLLLQLLRYYKIKAAHMPLLVLDSSTPDIAAANQKNCAAIGSQVTYRHYSSSTPMAEKLAQGMNEVTTPTVSFCADDDVVFPQAIDQSISFLNQAPDFVCSHGLYINFGVQGAQVNVTREYGGSSNLAGHAGARIFRLFQNYESLLYAVFRTPDLQRIFANVRHIPSLHFQELFQSVAALILGKANRFPEFYAGRRAGPEAEPGRDKWQTYYWFADDAEDMMRHYSDYRTLTSAFYRECGAAPLMSEKAFLRAFDLAHGVFFARNCQPEYFHQRLQEFWPADPFIKNQADLFENLRGATSKVMLSKLRALFARAHKAIRHTGELPALARMNKTIDLDYRAGRHQQPWHCELPSHFLWLAKSSTFRNGFTDLCRYLDCA